MDESRLNTDDLDPVVRFAENIFCVHWCYPVFGLIRRSMLQRTRGMGNFSHGDGVLLAHLSLLGRFVYVDEPLFISRDHAGRSMRQFGASLYWHDYRAYTVWFDPSRRVRLVFPKWRILREYQRVVTMADRLTLRDRARCEALLMSYVIQNARPLAGDLYRGVRPITSAWRMNASPRATN
jgi:hypothetical protein